ncbi:hypothetical protein MY1884_006653 [Beauveria asiatica]
MEASPLTRQPQPEVFTPKINQLYAELFQDVEEGRQSKGFWREFFLLKPDLVSLRQLLRDIPPADMLLLEGQSQELFGEAIDALKSGCGNVPQNVLDTLKVFLSCVLTKRYAHPSSANIAVLAGLDRIDLVFTDFVTTLDTVIRAGDDYLFPAVIKFIQDTQSPAMVLEPLILLSLLANYNKFEFQNPYQLRLNDFINEGAITTIVTCIGAACQVLRTDYINVQDDLPEGWTFSNALGMLGLGAIAPGPKQEKKPVYDADTAKQMFTKLPKERAAMLLAAYDFSHANKLFSGEAFLPTPAAYDDLFYKIVESGEVLAKFKQNYGLGKRIGSSIDTLINVSTHYKQLLTDGGGKKKPHNLTTTQVTDVIKQGYETLSIQAKEGLDSWDRYREADDRSLLKNMVRTAVADVRELVEQE